ncbi:MAG: APC family permease [Acidobacteriota bacterium]
MTTVMSEKRLIRAVGLKSVIALTINGIIGAGIFALPATAGKILGIASPIAFILAGFFACLIVLCFAELGSRYDRTGGAYLYAHEAFGGVFAFLVGWMYFLARISSVAALSNAMVDFATYFGTIQTPLRVTLILLTFLFLGGANYIGIKFSSRAINVLTAGKLIPLFLLIGAGLFFVDWQTFSGITFPPVKPLFETLLLAMFVFSGFEIVAVPGGEIVNPQKNVPHGLLIGTIFTIIIYFLIQVVVVATHPDLNNARSPLAEAAAQFLGPWGGNLISAGAIFSTLGCMLLLVLAAPRILYAMSLQEQMPVLLQKIHPRFRTPHVSIVLITVLAALVAVSGKFRELATLSAMARLVTYVGAALALLKLRRKNPSPESFHVPGGPAVPLLTILLSLLLLTAATPAQWRTGLIALAVGILLYILSVYRWRTRT